MALVAGNGVKVKEEGMSDFAKDESTKDEKKEEVNSCQQKVQGALPNQKQSQQKEESDTNEITPPCIVSGGAK
eukprot:3405273-Ditylum_brightwellii.AAC.1